MLSLRLRCPRGGQAGPPRPAGDRRRLRLRHRPGGGGIFPPPTHTRLILVLFILPELPLPPRGLSRNTFSLPAQRHPYGFPGWVLLHETKPPALPLAAWKERVGVGLPNNYRGPFSALLSVGIPRPQATASENQFASAPPRPPSRTRSPPSSSRPSTSSSSPASSLASWVPPPTYPGGGALFFFLQG